MTRPSRQAGFSLIEIIAVLVIIAVITAVAIPRITGGARVTAGLAADLAAADIRAVQQAAMTSGSSKSIVFGGSGYLAQGLHPSTRFLPGEAVASPAAVSFNSLGEPTGPVTFTVSCGNEVKSISIQALTGKVLIL